MTPQEGLQLQIEAFRRMTGEQRLKTALDLHEFACHMSRCGIRHQFPDADEDEVERQLRRRLKLAQSND